MRMVAIIDTNYDILDSNDSNFDTDHEQEDLLMKVTFDMIEKKYLWDLNVRFFKFQQ